MNFCQQREKNSTRRSPDNVKSGAVESIGQRPVEGGKMTIQRKKSETQGTQEIQTTTKRVRI